MSLRTRILACIPLDGHPDNKHLLTPALRRGLEDLGDVTWRETREPSTWLEDLRTARPDLVVGTWSTPSITPACLDAAPDLRAYVHLAGGLKANVHRDCFARGLAVSNWGELPGPYVAEGSLALLLAGLRQLSWFDATLHAGGWRDHRSDPHIGSLFGRRVGIHGFGVIGRALVPLLKPFGCHIVACDPFVTPEYMRELGVESAADAADLYRRCTAVVNLLPAIPATRQLVNAELLRLLPDGAVYVLTGRGMTTDFDALTAELVSGRLRGALDVFTPEPLPLDSPLRRLPNCVLQPHTALADDAHAAMVTHALERVRQWCTNGSMRDEVTRDRYDGMT